MSTTKQAYVLPVPHGWAVVTYGADLADDTIMPLPLTDACSYADVVAYVETLDLGWVDGWSTPAELAACEPELAARVEAGCAR